jgi:hypothetical protein
MFLRFINGCLALIPVGAYWTFFSQKPQVLGLTGHNATNADALRACMNRGGPPALLMAEAAERRLASFAVVGDFARLADTARLASAVLRRPLNGTSYNHSTRKEGAGAAGLAKEDAEFYGDAEEEAAAAAAADEQERQSSQSSSSSAGQQQQRTRLHEAVLVDKRSQLRRAQAALRKAGQEQYASRQAKNDALKKLQSDVAVVQANLQLLEGGASAASAHLDAASRQAAEAAARAAAMDQAATRQHTVGEHFMRCTVHAQRRSARQRRTALSLLRWRDGSHWQFSAHGRGALPVGTLALLRGFNSADAYLAAAAAKLFDARFSRLLQVGVHQPGKTAVILQHHHSLSVFIGESGTCA